MVFQKETVALNMLRVYTSLTRKKEEFQPQKQGYVRLFVCGPTVYDLSHIGHARTYVAFDMIAKYLRWRGFDVYYLQNITDVDDKIIDRAKKLGTDPLKLARLEEKDYMSDVATLAIDSVTKYARASEYIPQILSQIGKLIKRGFAYGANGSVYFDITKFPEYGKLSHQKLPQLKKAVRMKPDPNKKHDFDFALWKAKKPGEPSWQSPWGEGRPGWHIEDTAISEAIFGPQYDMHGGSTDLIFPHHESEIAQMEAVSGRKPFVRYWLHTGALVVGGQKMSKSLGNFITIRNFLSKYSPEALRFLIISHHYRSPIDYSEKMAKQAVHALKRIEEFLERVSEYQTIKMPKKKGGNGLAKKIIDGTKKKFIAHMDDDFNTPRAVAVIFDLITKGNRLIDRKALTKRDVQKILNFISEITGIFGIIAYNDGSREKIPEKVMELLWLRKKYRKEKNWKRADEIRGMMMLEGYRIEDTKEGPVVKKNK